MKKSTLLLVFLHLAYFTSAQNNNSFEKTIEISDHFYAEGDFQKAAEFADKAYEIGKKNLNFEESATALNRHGKALFKIPKRVNSNRAKAAKSLKQSLELTKDKDLKLNNLQMMRKVALARNRIKDIEEIDDMIANIRSGKTTTTKEGLASDILFGKGKKEALKKVKEIQEEKSVLASEVSALSAERKKLARASKNLRSMVAEKEEAIALMNEEQLAAQLLLMEQEYLVDSMAYTSLMDSMYLANQSIKNQELRTELNLERSQRNFILALAGLGLIIAFGMFSRYMNLKKHSKELEEKNRIIEKEQERSEELLLNILPKIVADELKENGFANARRFDNATVLFSDFKNFSQISTQLSPEQLVRDLDYCFKAFDEIIEKHGLEKIKTIGDAYMCAGGLPKGSNSTAKDVILAALDIQIFLEKWKVERIAKKEISFEARIGIHTGPIVAGVVGKKKFAFDIWGDTVNVAARMEQSGVPTKVNISATTFEKVKTDFNCVHRGKVPAKNYGEVDMYFVEN